MTDPETGHLTDSGPATDQNRTPCRQASMSPCQQSVIICREHGALEWQRVDRVPLMIKGMEQRARLLTVQELAEYLGVPVATLYQWRHRREGPPGFRVGRHVRYRWSDVQEWIEHQLETSSSHFPYHVGGTVVERGR